MSFPSQQPGQVQQHLCSGERWCSVVCFCLWCFHVLRSFCVLLLPWKSDLHVFRSLVSVVCCPVPSISDSTAHGHTYTLVSLFKLKDGSSACPFSYQYNQSLTRIFTRAEFHGWTSPAWKLGGLISSHQARTACLLLSGATCLLVDCIQWGCSTCFYMSQSLIISGEQKSTLDPQALVHYSSLLHFLFLGMGVAHFTV